MASLPRGIRNHNPGNIDRGRDRWRGMAADQSADPRFVVFSEPEWGIRAIVRVLRSYRDRHGLDTVAGIVGRWAPPAENPTERYVAFVCDRLGVAPDQPLDIEDPVVLRTLVTAIVRKECGPGPLPDGGWYPAATLDEGIRRAAG
ncbi:hypothetical protein STAQ_11720 [Allostella sp. ATCC 35155]|nr:hypothetical protein STAQ_11720 [Stella sp. ATCC 35155]